MPRGREHPTLCKAPVKLLRHQSSGERTLARLWLVPQAVVSFLLVVCFLAALVFQGGCQRASSPSQQRKIPPEIKSPRVVKRSPVGEYGGSLRITSISDPKSFNPIVANETSSTDILNLMFVGLTIPDYTTYSLEPCLAESWQHDKAGKVWTFTLRQGVKWSDGTPLTADDVVFTFNDVVYNRDIPNPGRDLMMVDGKPYLVEKIDARTVRISLPAPYSPLLYTLTQPIVPRHRLEDAVRKKTFSSTWGVNTKPEEVVCSGPFLLREYRSGERVVLERNPLYWSVDEKGNQLPYLDRVIFLTVPDRNAEMLKFQSGESDLFPKVPPRFYSKLKKQARASGYHILDLGPDPGPRFLTFNQNPAKLSRAKWSWFTSKKFRQAVAHAVDRESIIRLVFAGKGYPTFEFHPKSPYYEKHVRQYPYSLEKAGALLKEGGFSLRNGRLYDGEGNRVVFTLLTNAGNVERKDIGQIVKDDLEKLGMEVTFQPIDFNLLISKLNSTFDWDAVILALVGDSDIEPLTGKNVWMSSGFTHEWYPQQKTPATPWEKEIDEIFNAAAGEMDLQKKKILFSRMQKIIAEELPLIYTATAANLYAVSNRLRNFSPAELGWYFNDVDHFSMLYLK